MSFKNSLNQRPYRAEATTPKNYHEFTNVFYTNEKFSQQVA